MAIVIGRNGRKYDTSTGKTIESVPHPETRSKEELARVRAAAQPKQPSGAPDPDSNPWLKTIEAEKSRHSALWLNSDTGKRKLAELQRHADRWEQQRQADRDKAAFELTVADLVGHATTQVQTVLDDPSESVESCELATAALEAAKRGDRPVYLQWEQARNGVRTQKLAQQLADKQISIQKLQEERDAILQSGLDYKPEPVPQVAAPQDSPNVDRSHVAITKRVATAHGFREETVIVPRDEIQ